MTKMPQINVAPIYEIDLKILNKSVKYSPYTIAQEKAILTASESKDSKNLINNYIEIMNQCVRDDIDISSLSVIDFLNLVISLRCKSSDEVLSIQRKECKKCKKSYPFEVDLLKSLIYENEDKRKDIVSINDSLSVEIKPLRFDFLKVIDKIENEIDAFTYTAAFSITKVIYEKKIYENSDPQTLIDNVLVNLTKIDLQKIFNAANSLITIKMEIKSKCPHCGEEESDKVDEFLKFLN